MAKTVEQKQYDSRVLLAEAMTAVSNDIFKPLISNPKCDTDAAVRHGWTQLTVWAGNFTEEEAVKLFRNLVYAAEQSLAKAKGLLAMYDKE